MMWAAFGRVPEKALDPLGTKCATEIMMECRYMFSDEAAAADSQDGRSSEYVVARSQEDALKEAQSRCAHKLYRPDDVKQRLVKVEGLALGTA